MNFKTYIIAVYFVIFQETVNSAPFNQSGINSCQRRVEQLQSQIGFVVSQARLEISIVITGIQSNLNAIRFNINYQLAELKHDVNQVSGNNVQLCVDQVSAALEKINNEDLNFCYANADIDILNMQINKINELKQAVGQVCNTCYETYGTVDKLKDRVICVDSDIVSIRKQVEIHINEVSLGAITVQNKSSRCAQEVEDDQAEVITMAASSFDKCVRSGSQLQSNSHSRFNSILDSNSELSNSHS